jgi:hypothetical protein
MQSAECGIERKISGIIRILAVGVSFEWFCRARNGFQDDIKEETLEVGDALATNSC